MQIEKVSEVESIYHLDNGLKYKVLDTQKPYSTVGEIADGGYIITAWCVDHWSYIDSAPNQECLTDCLKAFNRKSRIVANELDIEIRERFESTKDNQLWEAIVSTGGKSFRCTFAGDKPSVDHVKEVWKTDRAAFD